MTTPDYTFSDALENLSDNAVRLAYDVVPSPSTPHLRHIVSVTADRGLEVQIIDEEEHQPFPRRSKGNRTVADLDSFVSELARRPLDERGTLWGTATAGKLVAVYNDHDINPMVGGWRDDTLTLQLKQDPDWADWHAMSGKLYRQSEFGDRVEELLHTVIAPDQAELLEVIDTVRASTKGEFENTISRADGAQKVTYHTEVSATAGKATRHLEVPQTISLRLRPWDGHPTFYDIDAYFRLKIEGQHLHLAVKLKPTRTIIRDAWAEITQAVAAATAKPVYAV